MVGKKKKKSLANRLAKMSDEDRARYLQHRADIEEEAKRRKEELVSIFMKKKIKKEDAFARLNLAKINQHWHHILRLSKCKEMKENVQHMKSYIERVLLNKNRIIANLMDELELSEEQYSQNFKAHSKHIENIIDSNKKHLDTIQNQFEDDLSQLLETASKEKQNFLQNSENQITCLKYIICGLELKAKEDYKTSYENYLEKRDDLVSSCCLELERSKKRRKLISNAIWRQIAAVVESYIQQTDSRRFHLAELKRIDADSAVERASNQEYINELEEELKFLITTYNNLVTSKQNEIKHLQLESKQLSKDFLKINKLLNNDLALDDKKLIILTDVSNKSIDYLSNMYNKGRQIVDLMNICSKFETERERLARFFPPDLNISELNQDDSQKYIETVEKIDLISTIFPSMRKDFMMDKFEALKNMEQFWIIYNKAEVDFIELKREKRILLKENNKYKEMLKTILEAVALTQSIPNYKASNRILSGARSAFSAPVQRVVF